DRASQNFLAALEADDEGLIVDRAFPVELHTRNAVAVLLAAIPGAMLGNEDLVAIVLRKCLPRVELHAERSNMRTEQLDRRHTLCAIPKMAEFRIFHVLAVAIRKAEIQSGARRDIELARRHVIA